ncbi:alpha/beta fold hydrolase [Candidatus Binatia bacterium]|nr:alpha/beta fold hydrolase [Candidatus Binatia bacterium]
MLLVHGFTGTPHEMEPLAEPLAAAGFGVLGLRLPGHGVPEPGEPNEWDAWEQAVLAGFAELEALRPGAPRAVVGLSMGALLALELGRRSGDAVRSIVTLSPAVTLPPAVRAALWLAARTLGARGRQRLLPKGQSDIADAAVRAVHPKSPPFPIAAALSFNALRLAVRARVGAVVQPQLIIHSQRDRTCPVAGAHWLARHTGAHEVELVILEKSGHVIPVDVERAQAADRIVAFLERTLAPHAAVSEPPVEAAQAAVHDALTER